VSPRSRLAWGEEPPPEPHIWRTLGYRGIEQADGRSVIEWDATPEFCFHGPSGPIVHGGMVTTLQPDRHALPPHQGREDPRTIARAELQAPPRREGRKPRPRGRQEGRRPPRPRTRRPRPVRPRRRARPRRRGHGRRLLRHHRREDPVTSSPSRVTGRSSPTRPTHPCSSGTQPGADSRRRLRACSPNEDEVDVSGRVFA
jgi:hypothetical protein